MEEQRRNAQPSRAAQRREQEARARKRQKQRAKSEAAKSTQRTPPRALPRRTLVLKLVVTLAVAAALMLGITIFFKVQNVRVTGNAKYTAQEIIDASGIQMGENLLTLGKPKAAGKIQAELPYVGDVQIGIKLPNLVNIDIVELEARFVIADEEGTWWIMDSGGKILEKMDPDRMNSYARVVGVQTEKPVINELAVALEPDSEDGADILGTAAERMEAAVEILTELQHSDRGGQITEVNVEGLYDIQVLYGEQYQVIFGGPLDLTYKTRYMVQAIEKLGEGEYRSGILDLTFSEPGRAIFTPW